MNEQFRKARPSEDLGVDYHNLQVLQQRSTHGTINYNDSHHVQTQHHMLTEPLGFPSVYSMNTHQFTEPAMHTETTPAFENEFSRKVLNQHNSLFQNPNKLRHEVRSEQAFMPHMPNYALNSNNQLLTPGPPLVLVNSNDSSHRSASNSMSQTKNKPLHSRVRSGNPGILANSRSISPLIYDYPLHLNPPQILQSIKSLQLHEPDSRNNVAPSIMKMTSKSRYLNQNKKPKVSKSNKTIKSITTSRIRTDKGSVISIEARSNKVVNVLKVSKSQDRPKSKGKSSPVRKKKKSVDKKSSAYLKRKQEHNESINIEITRQQPMELMKDSKQRIGIPRIIEIQDQQSFEDNLKKVRDNTFRQGLQLPHPQNQMSQESYISSLVTSQQIDSRGQPILQRLNSNTSEFQKHLLVDSQTIRSSLQNQFDQFQEEIRHRHNRDESTISNHNHNKLGQQQFFQDAMKLGSSVMQLVSAIRKSNYKNKQRMFDNWKVSTFIQKNRMGIRTNDLSMLSGSETASGALQIVQMSRPMVVRNSFIRNSSFESLTSDLRDISEIKRRQNKDVALRKAMYVFARFKSRKVTNAFFSWKYNRFSESKKIGHSMKSVHIQTGSDGMLIQMPPRLKDTSRNLFKTLAQASTSNQIESSGQKPITSQKIFIKNSRLDKSNDENLSEDDNVVVGKDDESEASEKNDKRIINQMSTKLPFSNVANRDTDQDLNVSEISARVLAGLVPSKTNKTKELSKEQEKLYQQVLQSRNKDFQLILGNSNEEDTESFYHNIAENFGPDENIEEKIEENERQVTNDLRASMVSLQRKPENSMDQSMVSIDKSLNETQPNKMTDKKQRNQTEEQFSQDLQNTQQLQDELEQASRSHTSRSLNIEEAAEEFQRECKVPIPEQIRIVKTLRNIVHLCRQRTMLQAIVRWNRNTLDTQAQQVLKKKDKQHLSQINTLKIGSMIVNMTNRLLLKKQAKAVFIWRAVLLKEKIDESSLMLELQRKMNLKFAANKKELKSELKTKYKETRKFQYILKKIQSPNPNENVTVTSYDQSSAEVTNSISQIPSMLQHMPPNITVDEVELLSKFRASNRLPEEIVKIIDLYLQSKKRFEVNQQGHDLEIKVKQMCYDMMISVLEQQAIQSKPGFRSNSSKNKSRRVREESKKHSYDEVLLKHISLGTSHHHHRDSTELTNFNALMEEQPFFGRLIQRGESQAGQSSSIAQDIPNVPISYSSGSTSRRIPPLPPRHESTSQLSRSESDRDQPSIEKRGFSLGPSKQQSRENTEPSLGPGSSESSRK